MEGGCRGGAVVGVGMKLLAKKNLRFPLNQGHVVTNDKDSTF